MRSYRKKTTAILAVILALSFIMPVYAQATQVGDKQIAAKGAAVIDFDTGTLLFGHNEAVQRVPASMLKMIAVHVVYDAIRDGKVSMDSSIKVSAATAAFSRDMTYSNVPLTSGASYTVRKLLEVVIVRSACAATVALGEGIFGSEKACVERMNAKAASLNIRGTFVDCWGGSPNNRVSPLAFAWLMQALIKDYPEVLEISSMSAVQWGSGAPLPNTNHLLTRYEGANGLKTGYTDPAGYCLTGTAKRGSRMLIAVVMGATMASRFPDAEALLDYGFANADRILGIEETDTGPDTDIDQNPETDPDLDPDTNPNPNPSPTPKPPGTANPSSANLILDGEEMPLSAYMINGSHYFKLRDIAFLLSGTGSQFEVVWNAEDRTIHLTSAAAYTPEGNEMNLAEEGPRPYRPTPSELYLDEVLYEFESYIIDGYNYFRLRDMAAFIGFDVRWIGETRTVIITTREPAMTEGSDLAQFGGPAPDEYLPAA